ncbi:hypothetical protein GUJ93_ZPchr0001g29701 [Zizania palustris]|uniref:Homeobox domain-containing protein n=1 Tax=Zizania palustris TaxID=103762 RepID=A0A8J5VBR6_ZIZPA|nr:hypothetical protein GUJ93_ZPchr0001g29701 [Zizania palustris]
MELVPFKPAAGALVESGGGAYADSIPGMVAAQQEMLHAQVDQLQRLVVAQCRLTGVNPLAQEMAAGALSIKIGKKPRDLLNPKAVNSMQSLFAVKDTIGKKESREISAFCGVTVTQVREFFASQRTRVRKFVRLSQEKALRIESSKAPDNVCSISTEQTPVNIEAHTQVIDPLRTLEPLEVQQCSLQYVEVTQISLQLPDVQQICAIPITPTCVTQPTDANTNPSSIQKDTKQEEVAPGVKLMEWILQINNATVLSWFLTMGGLTIMSTWLGEATTEEQTTVILVIFKVLLHLPLHKALPVHMSTVLQTINRLRFYRTQDISSKARNLLSRLSKVLVRSQALKKPQKDLICKQRISEILHDKSWKSELGITEEILALTEDASENRMPEPRKTQLLLTAADESNKKSSLQTKSKQRRKVLLVEHPNRKAAVKNLNPARSTSTNNSRPLSADDIQKAKMRAMFMQEKYGKVDPSKVTDKPHTPEIQKPSGLVDSNAPIVPRSPLTSTIKQPVYPSTSTSKQSTLPLPDKPELPVISKLNVTSQENFIEKLDSKRVLWQIPPDVWIDPAWSLGAGENSKEFDVQTQRNRRDKETFYASLKDIPSNPKDPWDVEMDFDDSLTPEIPIDQPPDADAMEADSVGTSPPNIGVSVADKHVGSTSSISPAVAAGVNGTTSEPDLELLAVLLKNPQLVFALTSNQGGTLPSEQTVALLDMLKQTGLGLSELVNSLGNSSGVQKEPEPGPEVIPVSLPSPTPPNDLAARDVWRSEFPAQVRPPNLQQAHLPNRANAHPVASTVQQSFSNVLAFSVNPPTQHVAPMNNLSRATVHQHPQPYALASDPAAVAIHHQPAANNSVHEHAPGNLIDGLPARPVPPVSSNSLLQGQGLDRNMVDYQTPATDSLRSPELGSSQGFVPEPSRQWNYGQRQSCKSEPSRQWSSGQHGYSNLAEPSRQRSSLQQSYINNGAEPSRQWSSTQQGYNPEPSRPWNSGHQSQNPEASRQRSHGKQIQYNPTDGRSSYDHHWRR